MYTDLRPDDMRDVQILVDGDWYEGELAHASCAGPEGGVSDGAGRPGRIAQGSISGCQRPVSRDVGPQRRQARGEAAGPATSSS